MRKTSIQTLQTIPQNIFGFDLRQHLWQLKYSEDVDLKTVNFLDRLMAIDISDFDPKILKTIFVPQYQSFLTDDTWIESIDNEEIITRGLDLIVTLNKKQLNQHIKRIRENYTQVYKNTKNIDYLVRALKQVKYATSIFRDELDEIFVYAKKNIVELDNPFYKQLLIIELVAIYGPEKCQQELSELLEVENVHYQEKLEFRSSRFCIKSLQIIAKIDIVNYRIRMAANYMAEGDQQVSEKKSNTFYPTISQTYLKGLRMIDSIGEALELRKRLEKKVADEQKNDFKMLRVAGVQINPEIDLDEIHRKVLKFDIDSFATAYKVLLDIPVIPLQIIEEQADFDHKHAGGFEVLFPKTIKVGKKGAQIASQNILDSYKNNARYYYRDRMMAFIHIVKNKFDGYVKLDEPMVEKLLLESKSQFLPPDRIYIYVQGITEGFNNNFITAAHILIPQIENSIRYLAEQNDIIVTSYAKELQFENLLGGCLEKISILADPNLIAELKSFLIDGNNVNFRNEIAHGMMDTVLIHKYGMYLWWLSIKMIMRTKELFPSIRN